MYLVKNIFQIFTREFHSYHVFNFLSGMNSIFIEALLNFTKLSTLLKI